MGKKGNCVETQIKNSLTLGLVHKKVKQKQNG